MEHPQGARVVPCVDDILVGARELVKQVRPRALGKTRRRGTGKAAQLGLEAAQLGLEAAQLEREAAQLGWEAAQLGLEAAQLGLEAAQLGLDAAQLGLEALGLEAAQLGLEAVQLGLEADLCTGQFHITPARSGKPWWLWLQARCRWTVAALAAGSVPVDRGGSGCRL
eukprot:gene20078-24036_t